MTVLADAIDVALRVAGALEQVGADYFVGGSFASSQQNTLDLACLRDWARRLGVTDLLDRARSEVE